MSRATIGEYVVTSKLGVGSFATVYKGYHSTTKLPVAIKALSLSKLNTKLLQNLELEIAILKQINHPNIVKLYDLKKTSKHMYLILEYCAGGDLQHYLKRQTQKQLPEATAKHFLKDFANGILCLYQAKLIHRDLKPQNLLLTDTSPSATLKIADFGFARPLATAALAETLCGSPLYMAPEILKFQKYDAKADLWSVGTILYEMVVGHPPYGGANHVQLLANIERKELQFPATVAISQACQNLLRGLLQRLPMNRMGFEEFFQHEYVDLQIEQVASSPPVNATETTVETEEVHEEKPSIQKSGNLEVMANVFGSTSALSTKNSGSDLNASITARTLRRATTQGIFQSTSPLLRPPTEGRILKQAPSPRINPFKQTSEALSDNMKGLVPTGKKEPKTFAKAASTTCVETHGKSTQQSNVAGNKPAVPLDSSEEYVLVDSSEKEKTNATPPMNIPQQPSYPKTLHHFEPPQSLDVPFNLEYAQQLMDIVILRMKAVLPLADHMFQQSVRDTDQNTTSSTWISSSEQPRKSSNTSRPVISSMELDMIASNSSLESLNITGKSDFDINDVGPSVHLLEALHSRAADAYVLYVACMRLLQPVILYWRENRLSPGVDETKYKSSLQFVNNHLEVLLEKAENCKKRIYILREMLKSDPEANTPAEDLLYRHALNLGKVAAVKEVLGQTTTAYELYLQAMLLLEVVLTSDDMVERSTEIARVQSYLVALEQRLQYVSQSNSLQLDSNTSADIVNNAAPPQNQKHAVY